MILFQLYPAGCMIAIGVLWLAAGFQARRLCRAFCDKHPQEAARLIPFSFSNTRHPEKLFFFFRRTSIPMLKADTRLWELRQQLKVLLVLSLGVPLACIAFLGFCAITGK
jgi:hypothetical protein